MVFAVMANQDRQIKIAVVGASGYSGQNLLRLLLAHPHAEIVAVTSRQEAGNSLTDVFPRFLGVANADELSFVAPEIDAIAASGAECAFLALPHGIAVEFAGPLLEQGLRVIDLSADFRLRSAEVYEEFYEAQHPAPGLLTEAVYGLPEFRADEIRKAKLVASPGCYPTSILVPLIPLLREKAVDPASIAVASSSGVSGAGKKADPALLFAEVNESVRVYGAPKHRHLSEIEQELSIAAEEDVRISFVPQLIPVTAGISTTIFCEATDGGCPDGIAGIFDKAYRDSPFVRILGEGSFPDTKNVVGTNFIDVGWVRDERAGRLILLSVEDNLGKGASSQAVQSFNLMFGLAEPDGLRYF